LAGLQEVVYPMQQDRLLGASGTASYAAIRGWAGRPEYGNSILVREGAGFDRVELPEDEARVDLDLGRCAVRTELRFGERSLRFVTTHLHHLPEDEALRDGQVERLVGWLDGLPATDALIVTGDFNAEPDEPAYERMTAAGFRSAHPEATGGEPGVTWPSGLIGLQPDVDGPPGCLDYVWLRGSLAATAARTCFDRPAVGDATLFASDHFGVLAEVDLA
jgi:endonuclease/exonuclease/phosphatase family metal-dependent hydrolase